MIQAELRNKLGGDFSRATPRSEDLLTSSFFGLLGYLPESAFNVCFTDVLWFSDAEPKGTLDPFWPPATPEAWKYKFWKWLPRVGVDPPGEIDLLLEGRSLNLGIEVKYDSILDITEDNNQLVRYWRALGEYPRSFRLLYLTKDLQPPVEEIVDALTKGRAYGIEVGWISWTTLHKVLKNQIASAAFSGWQEPIAKDLIALLESRDLVSLRPFPPIAPELSELGSIPGQWFRSGFRIKFNWPPQAALPALRAASHWY